MNKKKKNLILNNIRSYMFMFSMCILGYLLTLGLFDNSIICYILISITFVHTINHIFIVLFEKDLFKLNENKKINKKIR